MSHLSPGNRLHSLARADKWYLSCGDGIIWAPTHPLFLHCPGFWDEALVYYHSFQPLFSVAFVGPDGNDVALTRLGSHWSPDRLVVEWSTGDGSIVEERTVRPGGEFVSQWRPAEGGWPRSLRETRPVAFSVQPGNDLGAARVIDGGVFWKRLIHDRSNDWMAVGALLNCSTATSVGAMRSEGTALPSWRHTPFWERWSAAGGLDGSITLEGIDSTGLVYLAVAGSPPQDDAIEFCLRLQPAFATEGVDSDAGGGASSWEEFAAGFPSFACSNGFLQRYFDYRIYGLGLNRLAGGAGNVKYPAFAEGIGYFHVPISYSAQCHMWEARWFADPCYARGSLLNFVAAQRDDGSFPGRIYTRRTTGTDFYHANWGDAVAAVDAVHPDREFLETAYLALSRYARWLDETRDRDGTGLYDVVNHFETGQEFMSRYQVVDDRADREGWTADMRLKGVDVTVYTYQLKRFLAGTAVRLDRSAEEWADGAERIGAAITALMWSDDDGFFSDVDPARMARTGVRAAVGFYPLLTDLLNDDQVRRLVAALGDPEDFGTPYPVPSSSVSDRYFAAEPLWKGKRHNCPWNGRVWPMVNSHVIEGLLRQWHGGRRYVGDTAARLLVRFVEMMFHGGDIRFPNCFEHYNPINGRASVYRGVDDYMHSWVLDLLVRGVAGLEPTTGGLLVDPLPIDCEATRLSGVRLAGREVSVERNGPDVVCTVDGRRYETTVGNPLAIDWEDG